MAYRHLSQSHPFRSQVHPPRNANPNALTHHPVEFWTPSPQSRKKYTNPSTRKLSTAMGKLPPQWQMTQKLVASPLKSMPSTAQRLPLFLNWRAVSFVYCVKTTMTRKQLASEMGAHQVGLRHAASMLCARPATGNVPSHCGAANPNACQRQDHRGRIPPILCTFSTALVMP